MPLPKPKKTKRKFYNKWIYKISCRMHGAYALRVWDFTDIVNVASGGQPNNNNYWTSKNTSNFLQSANDWMKLGLILVANKDKLQVRVEGDNVDVYTSAYSVYDAIGNEFADSEVVWRRFEPTKGTEQDLLDSKNTVFVKHLPHNKYLYKVYLLPHKLGNIASREKLCNWLEKQQPKITFTPSIREWVMTTKQNWDRRYIYVQDDNTLVMLRLRENALIGKTYKHIIK